MSEQKRKRLYDGYLKVEKDSETGHEILVATDSVGILMYDIVCKKVILVEQSRDPMKGKTDEKGMIIEVPAGRFDCDLGLVNLVIKEVKEETGIDIQTSDIERLNYGEPLALCPGTNTERMYLIAVELDLSQVVQDDKVYGAAGKNEKIHRLVISIDKFISMTHQDMKTLTLANFLHAKMLYAELERPLQSQDQ